MVPMPGPCRGATPAVFAVNGTQRVWLTGSAKDAGITPTTVRRSDPSSTAWPTMDGSRLKRVSQRRSPITATGGAPIASSASTSDWPSSGGIRATRKAAAPISTTCTGRPVPPWCRRFLA